jgi:hypothetical protein
MRRSLSICAVARATALATCALSSLGAAVACASAAPGKVEVEVEVEVGVEIEVEGRDTPASGCGGCAEPAAWHPTRNTAAILSSLCRSDRTAERVAPPVP